MLESMDKDIMADLVSLADGSDPEPPCTPDAGAKAGVAGGYGPPGLPSLVPVPCASGPAGHVPGIPPHLPEPTAPPLDEVVSGLFTGEHGDLSSELAAALADVSEAKPGPDKLEGQGDPLGMYSGEGGGVCGEDVVMAEGGATYPGDRGAGDFFEMASFLGESEDTKQNLECLGMEPRSGVSDGRALGAGMADQGAGGGSQWEGASHGEESAAAGDSGAYAVGIPYYVACQWQQQQQVQQQQQQQQQAAVMLWWQAYLSSYGGMFGAPGGMPPAFPGGPAGWGVPPPGMQLPPGMFPSAPGPEALIPGLANGGMGTAMGAKAPPAGANTGQTKRRRRQDSGGSGDGQGDGMANLNSANRKGRRPRQEERVCKNCGTRTTPFWRKDKHDGLPLCNACGLYLSKNDAPRPKVLWKSADPSAVAVEQSNATCM